jgi:excisionase family DNA binding protein
MIDLQTTHLQFLLPIELAEILRVSRRTVYVWIAERRIATVKVANSVRIPIAEARRLTRISPPKPAYPVPSKRFSVQPSHPVPPLA